MSQKNREDSEKNIEGAFTIFTPGQLVKPVDPQNTCSHFIGTVIKVEPALTDSLPRLYVWVTWMHSGVTEQWNNYHDSSIAWHAPYLVVIG